VFSKWCPELKHYSPNTPIVLVGTKLDLRIETSDKFVTQTEGRRMKQKIGAAAIVECSAANRLNLDKVLEEAVRATEKRGMITRVCTLL
jgi:Ras-related C3 botulinum toxin substrate 1